MDEKEVDERFTLTYRKLKGEVLTREDLERLRYLNEKLDALLIKPEPLPKHIRDLVDKILGMPE